MTITGKADVVFAAAWRASDGAGLIRAMGHLHPGGRLVMTFICRKTFIVRWHLALIGGACRMDRVPASAIVNAAGGGTLF